MKRFIPFIILLLFIACSPEQQKESIDVIDSISKIEVLAVADSLKDDLVFNSLDTTMLGETRATITYINKLQNQVMYGQMTQVELIGIKRQLRLIRSDKKDLFNKIEQLKKDKSQLEADKLVIRTELDGAASKIKQERENLAIANKEKNKLQAKIDNAGILTLAGIKVESFYSKHQKIYSLKKMSVKDTLIYLETLLAKKVERVTVSFVVPQSTLFTPKEYKIIVVIHGIKSKQYLSGLKDSVSFIYNGTEQEHTIAFNQPIEWESMKHIIKLYNDNKLLHTDTLTLK